MKNLILATVLMMGVAVNAVNAGVLIEPFFGTHLNSKMTDNDAAAGDKDEFAITGTGYGARLGYQSMLGFMFGVGAKMATLSIEDNDKPLNYSHYTAFVGYDFPVLLRLWFEMGLSSSGKQEGDDGVNYSYKMEKITNIGIGYKVMPFMSLNLEIGSGHASEVTNTETDAKYDIDRDISTYMLSVSFPISL